MPDDPNEQVKLKNGSSEARSLVNVVMISLRKLIEDGYGIAFYELNELCKDSSHKLFGNSWEVLRQLSLVEAEQLLTDNPPAVFTVHDSIRNIVLSAATGEGLSLSLTNPEQQ